MKCPICDTTMHSGADRCRICGYRPPQNTQPRQTPTSESAPASSNRYYVPPNRKNSPKGCCFCAVAILLPLVILIVILTVVAFNAVVEHITPAIPEPGYFEDDAWTETFPSASEDCFVLEDGALTFLPENWDGSPILQIPDSVGGAAVTSIAKDAFRDCDFLTTILLPRTVTALGDRSFAGCGSLRGLLLPSGVTSIGTDAFLGCKELEAISIPDTVESIASHCFDDCAALHFIFYGGSFEQWDDLYSDYITPFTSVSCTDGYFYHGAKR